MRAWPRSALLLACALGAAGASAGTTTEVSPKVLMKGRQKQMVGPESVTEHQFHKAGWITAFSAHVVDAKGARRDGDDVFCHTALSVPQDLEHLHRYHQSGVLAESIHAALGDGQNEIRFPEGYGIPVSSGGAYELESVLHSDDESHDGEYRFETSLTTVDADSGKKLKDLSDLVVAVNGAGTYMCHDTAAFDVPPGRHTYEKEFTMPVDASVHYILMHAHRYAREAVVLDKETGKELYRGQVALKENGYPSALPFYSSAEGFRMRKGRKYLFRLVEDNPSKQAIDGMAVMRLYIHQD